MESRPKLTLNKPLSPDTLVKIKLKHTPQEIDKAKAIDQKNKRLRIKTALDWLCTQYPACFNRSNPKPLKFKIEQDLIDTYSKIVEATLAGNQDDPLSNLYIPSKKSLREAVAYYARNINYHRAVLNEAYRIDLQGQELPDYPVTPHQREYALKIIALVDAKIEAKKKNKSNKLNHHQHTPNAQD